MTKELYINGQLCDLEDTPSLIFQSPVFNDLDVIQSNRSAEINLPLTPRNRKAFGLIDRIDILDDSAAYRKHSAAYYLGGFPIFTRGYAMVTDVTDTINITLVWGNIDNFQPLFDASLRDLREQIIEVAGADYVEWNENTESPDSLQWISVRLLSSMQKTLPVIGPYPQKVVHFGNTRIRQFP